MGERETNKPFDPNSSKRTDEMKSPREKLGEKTTVSNAELTAILKESGIDEDAIAEILAPSDASAESSTPAEYYSLAELVAELAGKMNDHEYFSLSKDETERLLNALEINKEIISIAITKKDQTVSALSGKVSDEKLEAIKKTAERRINKHRAFSRYIEMIFTQDQKRKKGQGDGTAPNINEAKKENSAEVNTEFDGGRFETQIEGIIPELAQLRERTTTFTTSLVKLRADYTDADLLDKASKGSADYFLPKINTVLTGIDDDLSKLERVEAHLNDETQMFDLLTGDQGEDRRRYIKLRLIPKLEQLRKALEQAREPFQNQKDIFAKKKWESGKPSQLSALERECARVAAEAGTFSQMRQFADLRASIQGSADKVSLDTIREDLKKEGMSNLAVRTASDEIQTKYLDNASKALGELDKKMFDFWNQHLDDETMSPESATLEKAMRERVATRKTSAEDMALRKKILERRKKLADTRDVYLSPFASTTVQVEAATEFDRRLTDAQDGADKLLESARQKVKGDMSAHTSLVPLHDAINATTGSIDQRIQTLTDAITTLEGNRNTIIGSFEADLVKEVTEAFDAEKKAATDKKTELETEKRATVQATVEAKRKQVSLLITEINKPDFSEVKLVGLTFNFPDGTILRFTRLEEMLTRLQGDFAAYSSASEETVDSTALGALQYEKAEEKLKNLIKEKKELSDEGILELIDQLEAGFKNFDDQEKLWNQLNDVLKKLKEKDPARYESINNQKTARKDLHATWRMVEAAFASERLIDALNPAAVDVTSTDLSVLFKIPGVADAKRLFDEIDLPDSQRTQSIPELADITAANFQKNKGRISNYVASQTSGRAAQIAYRLHWVMMSPSESDVYRDGKDKDEPGEVMHSRNYREKYMSKDRKTGPSITIDGLFNETGNYKDGEHPIIVLPNKSQRGPRDPGWDLFPGFLHWCYEGTLEENQHGNSVRKPSVFERKKYVNRIIDFANKNYRNTDGQLMYETMPWDGLEEDVLKKWMSEMKGVGKFIYDKIMTYKFSPGELSQEADFAAMMNKWQYAESYIYGIREYWDQPAEQKKVGTEFREEWLLGVIWQMFNEQPQDVENWTWDQVRNVIKAAQNSKFVDDDYIDRVIAPNVNRWYREALSIGARTADRLKKAVIEVEGHH